ncbi:Lrp/AsnC family transcriptional regulator [Anaerovibrio sp.]|uniref:siroheme decarboxylase subunit alpha n=1 Tax=Anaerovibrio sp. TaxID=1872532 RepID=UPI0025BFA26D|nr:Lrp/AsnC family transcriptional regulator [Anaerovibrio sp.]MBR2142643.1 Lrp/AsnC family transcriptional regulator [Anaerovibrio sp.]
MELTAFDKDLLNLLQGGIQFTAKPYEAMASQLGVAEEVVLTRLRELKAAGYIRKIGAFFNSDQLGYSGTLVAVRVVPEYLAEVAEKINEYPEITHNYQRRGDYGLWFTLITNNTDRRKKILGEIQSQRGVLSMMDLYSQKKYKIDVRFNLK